MFGHRANNTILQQQANRQYVVTHILFRIALFWLRRCGALTKKACPNIVRPLIKFNRPPGCPKTRYLPIIHTRVEFIPSAMNVRHAICTHSTIGEWACNANLGKLFWYSCVLIIQPGQQAHLFATFAAWIMVYHVRTHPVSGRFWFYISRAVYENQIGSRVMRRVRTLCVTRDKKWEIMNTWWMHKIHRRMFHNRFEHVAICSVAFIAYFGCVAFLKILIKMYTVTYMEACNENTTWLLVMIKSANNCKFTDHI